MRGQPSPPKPMIHAMTSIDPRTIALGLEIRDAAADQQIPMSQLAKKANVSRQTLYNWLDGERAMPLTGLVQIADVLGIQPWDLLHRAEERARRRTGSV